MYMSQYLLIYALCFIINFDMQAMHFPRYYSSINISHQKTSQKLKKMLRIVLLSIGCYTVGGQFGLLDYSDYGDCTVYCY